MHGFDKTMVLYIYIAIVSFAILLFICGKRLIIKRKSLSIAFDLSIMMATYCLKDNLLVLLGAFFIILAAYLTIFYFAIYKEENYLTGIKPTLTMAEKVEEYAGMVLSIIPLVLESDHWMLVLLVAYCMFEGTMIIIHKYLDKKEV